jgi:hypothetical protein
MPAILRLSGRPRGSAPYVSRCTIRQKGGFCKGEKEGRKTVGPGLKSAPTFSYGLGDGSVGRPWANSTTVSGTGLSGTGLRPVQGHRLEACATKTCRVGTAHHFLRLLLADMPALLFGATQRVAPTISGLGAGVWGRGQGHLPLASFPSLHRLETGATILWWAVPTLH